MVQHVISFKSARVVDEVVVKGEISDLDIRAFDYVFKIYDSVVPVARIYFLLSGIAIKIPP